MKLVSIELLKDHSIKGNVEKTGTVCDGIHEGVANDLIKRGIAKLSTPKKKT